MKTFVLLVICFAGNTCINAQSNVPPLERLVNLNIAAESIASVLTNLSDQTGIKFSYNPSVIPVNTKVSVYCKQKPVRAVLYMLFKNDILWKEKSDFIILTPKPIVKTKTQKYVTISGYVYAANGDKLATASVISAGTLIASVTNQYGYFKMNIPQEKLPIDVKVVKENYPDTIIHLTAATGLVDVSLPTPADSPVKDTSLTGKQLSQTTPYLEQLFVNNAIRSTMRNFKDTLFTKVQFSLVPYVSTNNLLAGNTINDVSLNLLAGYSQGIRKAEIGGIFNIDRGDVQLFQAAGVCNVVNGNTRGGQFAGVANINAGTSHGLKAAGVLNVGHDVNGVQLAGVFNVNANRVKGTLMYDTVKGIQAAGLANINSGFTEGIRLSGLFNTGLNMWGMQAAGFCNHNNGYFHGIQLAGFYNTTKDTSSGIQIAGFCNTNFRNSKHISISGFGNFTYGQTNGLQLSSVVNYSRSLKGIQLALLNFSDTCEGIPLGLISFVSKGYHKIAVFGDEVLYTQLAFRTGVLHFHNIFIAGVDLTRRIDALWSLGYGVGSYKQLNDRWLFGGDLTAQFLIQNESIQNASGMMGTLFVGFERTFTRKFSMAIGPTIKLMAADRKLSETIVPYTIYAENFKDSESGLRMWAGIKISCKFF